MKDSGFSLVELVVVIAILGALFMIAGLSGRTWLDRYRIESQVKVMYADLMNARASAMQKSRTYFVTLAPMQYTVYEDRDPANPSNPALDGDDIFEAASDRLVMQKDTQYPIVPAPAGTTSFSFDRNGLLSLNGTLHFDLTNASAGPAYDCITLFTTRILMGKWNGTSCDNQ
jgi:prepilin-type N-terminal cleavage/methylation domain-containing protein